MYWNFYITGRSRKERMKNPYRNRNSCQKQRLGIFLKPNQELYSFCTKITNEITRNESRSMYIWREQMKINYKKRHISSSKKEKIRDGEFENLE